MVSFFVVKLYGCFFVSLEPVFPFAVFPDNQDGSCVENGGVGSAENTHQQNDYEVTSAVAAKKDKGEERQHNGQLCGDGAIQSLYDGMIDHGFVVNAAQDA